MNDPSGWQWVPVEAVLDLYAEQIEEHGGRAGLRDENLLHSALARPVNSLHYEPEGATACRLAAAYAFGLACNHAFVDGNKRIALLTAATFLLMNGYYLDALEHEAAEMTKRLSERRISEIEYAAWLEEHSYPLP